MGKSSSKKRKRKARGKPLSERLAKRQISPALRKLASQFANLPVGPSYIRGDLQEEGALVTVRASRRRQDQTLALVSFLVDLGCLGIKDMFVRKVTQADLLQNQSGDLGEWERCAPDVAAKVVASAAQYARQLGFEPPPDFDLAFRVFDGVDWQSCPTEVKLGKDGKPFYCAGPRDDVDAVMAKLTEQLGPDGFHFLLPMDQGM